MDDSGERMLREGRALLSAAAQLERDAGHRASTTAVAPALTSIEQALRALSRACEAATHSIIPAGDIREPWPARFARAAADWPVLPGGSAPSYAEQARLLSSLHDAAAALRVAAKSTAQARDVVASKVPAASPTVPRSDLNPGGDGGPSAQ